MKLYINQEGLDFDTATHRTPVQEFDLAENLEGEIEYPVKFVLSTLSPFASQLIRGTGLTHGAT